MKSASESIIYRTRGGLLSLAELRLLAEAATAQGEPRLYSAGRQEIALNGLGLSQAHRLLGQPRDQILQRWSLNRLANIMTTGAVAGLGGTNGWLSEGIFRDLLASFTFAPARSIALTDPSQPYLPAFLGEICFLATERRDLWRIRLALPELGEETFLPGATRSMDVPRSVEIVEHCVCPGTTRGPAEVLRAITEALEPIQLPAAVSESPGLLRYESPPGALFVPIPDDGIRSDFCVDLCVWATRYSGVSVGLTPGHSLLVRGLTGAAMRELRALLVRRRVAENSGAWRTHCLDSRPDRDTDWLCRTLETQCPVDTGLSVGVGPAGVPAPDVHVLVCEEPRASWPGRFRPVRYTVRRRESGDARKGPWIKIGERIRRRDLATVVLQAIETITGPAAPAATGAGAPLDVAQVSALPVYRCRSCLSEYSAIYGDSVGEIPPGTPFVHLSAGWNCPVCEGPKSDYEAVAA